MQCGRPRSAVREQEILEAALAVLVEQGYDRMTIDAVAARARAGKATIYRRWCGKGELVLDALLHSAGAEADVDTGSLREDLMAEYIATARLLDPRRIDLVAAIATAVRHDPALRDSFEEHFVARSRCRFGRILERAVRRGEARPGVDVELVASVVPSLALTRALFTSDAVDEAYVRRLVDELLLPLASPGGPLAAAPAVSALEPAASPAAPTSGC